MQFYVEREKFQMLTLGKGKMTRVCIAVQTQVRALKWMKFDRVTTLQPRFAGSSGDHMKLSFGCVVQIWVSMDSSNANKGGSMK